MSFCNAAAFAASGRVISVLLGCARLLLVLFLVWSGLLCAPPAAFAQNALGVFSIFWNLFGLWAILQAGLAARLRDVIYQAVRRPLPPPGALPPLRALVLYFCVYMLLLHVWRLPVGLMALTLEHRYGFSRQSPSGYLSDVGLTFAFETLNIPLIWGGYWLYARFPHGWWKILWALTVPLLFFVIVLQPIVVAPAYNSFTPLPSGPLRDKILALASQAGISGANVYVESTSRRSTHVNAYVTGLGPTTRIVFNDTALRLLPEDQLLAMMGHEMGHYVEGHIWYGFACGSVGAGIFLWLASRLLPWLAERGRARWRIRSVTDLAALPLLYLFLTCFMLAQDPFASAISRVMEHRADAFGLRLTHLNAATARLFVGFAERDYSDPDPPFLLHLWFGTHPTLSERIAFALHYPSSSPR